MRDIGIPIDPTSTKFLDQLRLFIRSRNLAYNTEKAYVAWILTSDIKTSHADYSHYHTSISAFAVTF